MFNVYENSAGTCNSSFLGLWAIHAHLWLLWLSITFQTKTHFSNWNAVEVRTMRMRVDTNKLRWLHNTYIPYMHMNKMYLYDFYIDWQFLDKK